MAQHLKDDVRERIHRAALELFAREGYRHATMAAIGRRAGVSAGNLYRYYQGKRALFEAVVPAAVASGLRRLVRDRVRALDGVRDVSALGPDEAYWRLSRELLEYAARHRLEIVILLDRAEGTRHAGFAASVRREMESLAIAHFARQAPAAAGDAATRFVLERVYRDWVRMLVGILQAFDEPQAMRDAADRYSAYHLAGLNGLFCTGGGA